MRRNGAIRWADIISLFIGAVAAVMAAIYAATDVQRGIAVSAITIEDVEAGEPVYLSVARVLDGRWHGGYWVDVRDAATGELFCTTGSVLMEYSQYEANGEPRKLPHPTPLSWWAYGGTCTEKLAGNTLPVGSYTVETWHARRVLLGWYKWHRWQGGPVFEVTQ